ncbi:hypothetical protein [Polaromonas jejuensis]|uniref:AsmA family protein n=1 Tax=Polaromonas jejuensis TaxID=457502 RepID=A0ABW0QCL6_9BURK|nr:hypothetical protein [Polaromonas jejuensis]
MEKVFKWLVWLALGLMVLLAAVAFTLHRWIATGGFRLRVEREASAALSVPVTLGGVAVDVWPLPAVALSGIVVQSNPPLTLGRVALRPLWQPLLHGQLAVATLLVHRAVLPQQGIDALLLSLQKKELAAPVQPGPQPKNVSSFTLKKGTLPGLPRRTVLDDVTWISASGARTTLEGEARLGADGLPDSAQLLLLKGHLQGLRASLKRAPAETNEVPAAGDQWTLRIEVGGGEVQGRLGLKQAAAAASPARAGEAPPPAWVMTGQLQTKGVEVSALTAPSAALAGRLEATTTLNARATTTGALVDALQSHTTFMVRHAVLNGLDLARAVQTAGPSRGGQTPLDTLAGQVSTRGRAAQLSNLVASSGVLSAAGNVAISPARALSGKLTVMLAGDSRIGSAIGGAVGVPLTVGGTLDKPELTLSRSALLGAAIGTALLPGVGTGAGAKLGDRLGDGLRNLFGK